MKNIIILDKSAHGCYWDLAEYVRTLNDEHSVVCFGVQDWSVDDFNNIDFKGKKKIVYQLEVLDGETFYSNEHYVSMLKKFDEVWDYSEHNIPYLEDNGIKNTKYVPVLPSKKLKEKPKEKEIGVLHYGMLNAHRVEYINYAISNGYDVYDVVTKFKKDVFGEALRELIRKSKVVLGLHSFPNMPIQESVRYQYPLSNDITVVAEKSLTNPLHLLEFGSKKEMLDTLKKVYIPNKISLDIQPLVSIIMPVYNAENYLDHAINSVLRQTYSNWELICVNDGSTDKTDEKLHLWKQKEERIKVFNKKNEGPAKARAFGMQQSLGEYIIYLDADDQYSDDILYTALLAISKHNADAACPNLIQQKKDGSFVDNFNEHLILSNSFISGQDAFVRSLSWSGVHSLILCKANLFKKIACDEAFLYGNFNSDELIARVLFLHIDKLAFCAGKYQYNYNRKSITKKITPKIFGYLTTNIKLIDIAKKYNQANSVIAQITINSFREMIDLFHLYTLNKKEFTKTETKKIRREFNEYYSQLDKKDMITLLSKKGITQKIQILTLLINKNLCFLTLRLVGFTIFFNQKWAKKIQNKFYPWFTEEELLILNK